MATAEEANEFLGGFASDIDTVMAPIAPHMTFAIVFWVKGQEGDADAVAIFGPPEFKSEQPTALRTAAACLEKR